MYSELSHYNLKINVVSSALFPNTYRIHVDDTFCSVLFDVNYFLCTFHLISSRARLNKKILQKHSQELSSLFRRRLDEDVEITCIITFI